MNSMSRQELTEVVRPRYRKGDKKQKGIILNEYTAVTKYNRKYAIRKLNKKKSDKKDRRGRKPKYNGQVIYVLVKLWRASGCICSDRLKPFIPELLKVLKVHGEIRVSEETEELVTKVSRSQIDRLLAPYKLKRKKRWPTSIKPGTLLKEIPVRASGFKADKPGFTEIDLVHHNGGSSHGEYLHTLNLTDIFSGLSEQQAVMGRGQVRVHKALRDIEERLPFTLLGIDSDNGSEFINGHLFRYCQEKEIEFTRIRPYQKNDNAHIEQKNWHQIRKLVGYSRYDTIKELEILNKLYSGPLRLWNNFFQPVMKLKGKVRIKAKTKRLYDVTQTPYQRLLKSGELGKRQKNKLTKLYHRLNPIKLQEEVEVLLDELYRVAKEKAK